MAETDGKFITLEGPEGSGKTTQARRLIERIEASGRQAVYTREPGGTATGEAIRKILQHDAAGEEIYPETEVLLFEASRAQLVKSVISPALAAGKWVVCDRFSDSTTVYQGYGRGFDIETLIRLHSFAVGAVEPDLTLLLDIEIETGFERIAASGQERDRIESEAREFHQRVREGYLDLAQRFSERYRIVPADREPESIAAEIWEIVAGEFPG